MLEEYGAHFADPRERPVFSHTVRSEEPDVLPEWFDRPTPILSEQPSLFPEPSEATLAGLRVSLDDIDHWHDLGWLSFDRSALPGEWSETCRMAREIVFIRDLARSGWSHAQIGRLLAGLPRPYAFDSGRVALSLRYGWVEAVPFPDPMDVIEEGLDEWLQDQGLNRLEALRDQICDLIEHSENM